MSFLSWQYALLLATVFLLYWQLRWRWRIGLILAASYLFYSVWDARFLALLLTSTTIDFFSGLGIVGNRQRAWKVALASATPFFWLLGYRTLFPAGTPVTDQILVISLLFLVIFPGVYFGLWRLPAARRPTAFMLLSITTNLGVLGFFKYFNFFSRSLMDLAVRLGLHPSWSLPHILLPVGISFYTFQSISYAVDCHRGRARPSSDFLTFAAYLSFFPQLVAGPIERANDLLPQFEAPAAWDVRGFHRGLKLLLVGAFKKVFVADNCALVANYAFHPQTALNGPWAILGVLAFAFQIYGDFSGYTDIARGSAHLLGVRLNRNFHFPYFAANPSDFWQRWHITLSSWFRDYVYIPLGGNRMGPSRTYFNVWLTMLLAGLWHGANWTYLLWGAYHGTLLIAYRVAAPLRWLGEQKNGAWGWLSIMIMFAFTLLGWAIFRCHDLEQLGGWLRALGRWSVVGTYQWLKPALWCLAHVLPLLLWQMATRPKRDEIENSHWQWPARGLAYLLAFLAVAGSSAGEVPFIYFQF